MAAGLGDVKPLMVNMTSPEIRRHITSHSKPVTENIDHLIVGSPVHSGKLPVQVVRCLKEIAGHGRKCSVAVIYGNRDYGIALRSLVELLSEAGFNVVSAGAFIGQHTYSDIVPVAMNRPDFTDLKIAFTLGLESQHTANALSPDDIPIQLDKYSASSEYTSLKPTYHKKRCQHCGLCADACPLGLIASDSGCLISTRSKKQCIGCMACVKKCRQKARIIKVNPMVKLIMSRLLKQAVKECREPLIIVK